MKWGPVDAVVMAVVTTIYLGVWIAAVRLAVPADALGMAAVRVAQCNVYVPAAAALYWLARGQAGYAVMWAAYAVIGIAVTQLLRRVRREKLRRFAADAVARRAEVELRAAQDRLARLQAEHLRQLRVLAESVEQLGSS